jgi:hypothetical protein
MKKENTRDQDEALNYTGKTIYKLFQVWYYLPCPGM